MPDFECLRNVLLLRGGNRVPLIELLVDRKIKEQHLGRSIKTLRDEVEFWESAGYDYIPFFFAGYGFDTKYRNEGCVKGFNFVDSYNDDGQKIPNEGSGFERHWAEEGTGLVSSWKSFEKYQWPDPRYENYSLLEKLDHIMCPGMKVITGTAGIFERVWMLTGFEGLVNKIYEDPNFVAAMFEKVGSILLSIWERLVEYKSVGAMWISDDIAFNTGTILPPSLYREHLFIWYKRMGELCKLHGLPLLYHSDGNLWQVLDDLVSCGINAIHPVEPKAMNILEVKERYFKQLCLLGNIEVDRLARGSPEEIRSLVMKKLNEVGSGGYCVGSSNTITDYVRYENFAAMLETTKKYNKDLMRSNT